MEIKPGDICFEWHKWDPISEIIAFWTFPIIYQGNWTHLSHAQIVVNAKDNQIQVVSADIDGLNLEWKKLNDIPLWIIKTCLSMTDLQRMEIVRWSIAHRGVGYNYFGLGDFIFHFNMDEKNHLYCSQACFEAYKLSEDDYYKNPQTTGIELLKDITMVSPAHLYTSPLLTLIGGN